MIVHQAIGMTNPVKALRDLGEIVQKQFPVAVVLEDRFAIIASGGDVIKCAVEFDP
jgi:hypothetical protein